MHSSLYPNNTVYTSLRPQYLADSLDNVVRGFDDHIEQKQKFTLWCWWWWWRVRYWRVGHGRRNCRRIKRSRQRNCPRNKRQRLNVIIGLMVDHSLLLPIWDMCWGMTHRNVAKS